MLGWALVGGMSDLVKQERVSFALHGQVPSFGKVVELVKAAYFVVGKQSVTERNPQPIH